MSKQVTRVCDLCTEAETGKNDEYLINKGWTELQYRFGTYVDRGGCRIIRKDICPKCSYKIGLIKILEDGSAIRPKSKKEIPEEVEPTIEDHLRDFIVEIGSAEGWYNHE